MTLELLFRGRLLGRIVDPDYEMTWITGLLRVADEALYEELMQLIESDTDPPEEGSTEPSRRWDVEIEVQANGKRYEVTELTRERDICLKAFPR